MLAARKHRQGEQSKLKIQALRKAAILPSDTRWRWCDRREPGWLSRGLQEVVYAGAR